MGVCTSCSTSNEAPPRKIIERLALAGKYARQEMADYYERERVYMYDLLHSQKGE